MAEICTADEHEALKRDEVAWLLLQLVGIQEYEDDDGTCRALELRHCACGSTLATEVDR